MLMRVDQLKKYENVEDSKGVQRREGWYENCDTNCEDEHLNPAPMTEEDEWC